MLDSSTYCTYFLCLEDNWYGAFTIQPVDPLRCRHLWNVHRSLKYVVLKYSLLPEGTLPSTSVAGTAMLKHREAVKEPATHGRLIHTGVHNSNSTRLGNSTAVRHSLLFGPQNLGHSFWLPAGNCFSMMFCAELHCLGCTGA